MGEVTWEKFPKMQSGFKAGEVVVGEGWVWWGVRAQALQWDGRGFDSWLLGGLQGLSKSQVLCACDAKGNGKCPCCPLWPLLSSICSQRASALPPVQDSGPHLSFP